jgi:hypothetical protein
MSPGGDDSGPPWPPLPEGPPQGGLAVAVAPLDGGEVGVEAETVVGPVDVGDAAWLEPELHAAAASDNSNVTMAGRREGGIGRRYAPLVLPIPREW